MRNVKMLWYRLYRMGHMNEPGKSLIPKSSGPGTLICARYAIHLTLYGFFEMGPLIFAPG